MPSDHSDGRLPINSDEPPSTRPLSNTDIEVEETLSDLAAALRALGRIRERARVEAKWPEYAATMLRLAGHLREYGEAEGSP